MDAFILVEARNKEEAYSVMQELKERVNIIIDLKDISIIKEYWKIENRFEIHISINFKISQLKDELKEIAKEWIYDKALSEYLATKTMNEQNFVHDKITLFKVYTD